MVLTLAVLPVMFTVKNLCSNSESSHFSSPITFHFSFLDLLGKAKKKILKLDDILPNDSDGVSSASQLLSSYNPVDCEPQEIGKNGHIPLA
jgi:hypothetical protein